MRALILVDIQNDFMPGGPLGVPEGDAVVPLANRLAERFELVVATQDWHPVDHGSFAVNHAGCEAGDLVELDGLEQILWPVHCVQNTEGAQFVRELERDAIDFVFEKGTDPEIDSYSGFYDNGHRKETGLGAFLKRNGVQEVFVCGVATDYCVKYTALDAVAEGFATVVVRDACRGVELKRGDVDRAFAEMEEAGVRLVDSAEVAAEATP